jgi:hypothetical protein
MAARVAALAALVWAGSYPAASESVRMDMVRKQAALDLECPASQLAVQREVGFFEPYRRDGEPIPLCRPLQLVVQRSKNPPVDVLGPAPPPLEF